MRKAFFIAVFMLVLAGAWSGGGPFPEVPRAQAQEPCPDDLSACTYGHGDEGTSTAGEGTGTGIQ